MRALLVPLQNQPPLPSMGTTNTLPSSHTSKTNHQLPLNVGHKSPQIIAKLTTSCHHFKLSFWSNSTTISTRSDHHHTKLPPPITDHTNLKSSALFTILPLCENLTIGNLPSLPFYLLCARIICTLLSREIS